MGLLKGRDSSNNSSSINVLLPATGNFIQGNVLAGSKVTEPANNKTIPSIIMPNEERKSNNFEDINCKKSPLLLRSYNVFVLMQFLVVRQFRRAVYTQMPHKIHSHLINRKQICGVFNFLNKASHHKD